MECQVILITGALTGIGRAAALGAARGGHSIIVSGRNIETGEALVAELCAIGAEAAFVHADVRREEDVRAPVDAAIEWFGRLDAAINNAGTEGAPGPIGDQTADSYAATFDTNVLGTLLSLKHELRVMQDQGFGSIVNISSTYGHEGAAGASIYAASKHAVKGLTRSVARPPRMASASTQSRRDRPTPGCSIASPAARTGRRHSPAPCHLAGSARPASSPRRSCSSPRLRPRSSPVRC